MSAATATHAPAASPKEEYFRYTNLGPVLFGLLVATGVGLLVCLIEAVFVTGGLKQFQLSLLFDSARMCFRNQDGRPSG